MSPARRVAIVFDPDQLHLRQRAILRGIADHARAAHQWVWRVDPDALKRSPMEYDGIISRTGIGMVKPIAQSVVPVVCVEWGLANKRLNRAVENRYTAGRLAAHHLIESGYRSFAYVGHTGGRQSSAEHHFFRNKLRRVGRTMSSARSPMVQTAGRLPRGRFIRAVARWLAGLHRPLGVFGCRPALAVLLTDRLSRTGIRIPDDIGIVAADDDPALCEPEPAITSIRHDYTKVGRRAAELLDRLMDGEPPPKQAVLIPPTIVPRRSTDRAGLADPLVAKALWFIDDRRTESIRPCHVAHHVGLSQRVLVERLRRAGHGTLVHEITRARVEHAKIHLAQADTPVPVVARASGFGSVRSFRRAFRQHTGMTPTAWRRELGMDSASGSTSARNPRRT